MSEHRSLAHSLIRTGFFSFLGKGLGFLVPIAVAGWFGVGQQTDTFFIAYAFVFFAVGVWGQGIELAALPHLVRWRHAPDVDVLAEIRWAHRALFIIAVACALPLAAMFGGVILKSVNGVVSTRTAWICFIFLLPMFVASGASGLSAAALGSEGRFAVPALSQGFRAIGVLVAAALLRHSLGVASLAIGYSVGEALRLVVLEVYRRRTETGRKRPIAATLLSPGTAAREAWSVNVWPQFAALALVNAGPLVERWVAAHTGTGAITEIDYGLRLFAIPATIFDSSLAAVLLSHWSHTAQRDGLAMLRASTKRLVWKAFVLAVVIGAACIWQRHAIVDVLLMRGKFDAASAAIVSKVFATLMLGFPMGMAALVFERAFMAVQRTRALVAIAGGKLVVRGSVAIVLGMKFGVLGVAFAQPASSAVDLTLQLILWRKGMAPGDARA